MRTLTVANQKGGVGKTALVVNFALDFAERGARVAVVDMDVQGNSTFTLADHAGKIKAADAFLAGAADFPEAPEGGGILLLPADSRLMQVEDAAAVKLPKAVQNLAAALKGLEMAGYDICLLDSPAAFGARFMAGLLAADFILAPIELEAYSIQGIKQLVTTIANARKTNPRVRFLGMLANKVDRRNPRHVAHLEQLAAAYPNLLLPATIGLRTSIAEALVSGVPVWKSKKTAARQAAKEIRAAAEAVYGQLTKRGGA